MSRRCWIVLCATATLLPAGLVKAWEKPDFSGNWTLNAAKSDFGPMPGPDKMKRTIEHKDPSLKMTTTQTGPQGEVTTALAYTTDGTPSTNKIRGQDVTGIAKWDGDELTISSKREFQGTEITMNERWTLSEDGKTLTFSNKINTAQGDFDIKVVMDKQ